MDSPDRKTPDRRRVALGIGLPLAALASVTLAALSPGGQAFAGTVTVQPGQSLSQVAAEEGTTVAALVAANGITNPDLVDAGAVLQVPGSSSTPPVVVAAAAATSVTVEPGETLSALAQRYGTTAAALAAANGISDPNRIKAGMVLQLPGQVSGTATTAVTMVGSITVHAGDTLTSLAAHYGTTTAALAGANGISNPNLLFAGMRLTLPAAAVAVAGSAASGPVATGSYPTALLALPSRLALQPDFVQAASASGVPVSLLEALCWWESGWQTTAVSPTGALGVCQILPSTASFVSSAILQVAPLDPRQAADNIDLSAAYLRYLLGRTGGNASEALAGYSQGLASIAEHGVLPATTTYVTGILAYAAIFAGHG
jgi:LysM repeat protein